MAGPSIAGKVTIAREDAFGWVVFDHAARRNAITEDMWRAIPEAMAELVSDPAIRVIILRGAGDEAFVSGADISEFERSRIGPAAAEYNAATTRAFDAIGSADKPVIAMIHGFCVGGGAAIALQADLRYAAEDAVFAIPPAKLGLGYGIDNTKALVDVVGAPAAREILFTGRRVPAVEAMDLGLVNRVLAKGDLETYVRETATQITRNAPLTIRSSKTVLRELARDVAERDHERMEASVRACFESADYAEGVRAFLEKRRPRFRGE